MEQRKYTRLDATGMDISISDKIGFSTGTLRDISRFGICITDLPRQLQPENDSVVVVVTTREKRFKLQLRLQWEKQDGLMMATGAVIKNVPWDWAELVMQLERQENATWMKASPVTLRKNGLAKTLRRGVTVLKRSPGGSA